MEEDNRTITIGYWNIRGLAAPLRMQVMYAGFQLNNVTYDIVVDPTTGKSDASSWFNTKSSLKVINPLINLPYIQDGDRLITQSNACLLYLGRRFDMLGSNDNELCQCEQLLCEIMDLRNSIVGFVYSDKGTIKEDADMFLKSNAITRVLDKINLSKQLNTGTFFVGNKASSPDFHAWELFDQMKNYARYHSLDDIMINYNALETFYIDFKNLPNNQKYLSSKLYTYPMNNKSCSLGGTPDGGKYDKSMVCTWNTYDGIY
jgi:glutathione S-transferase